MTYATSNPPFEMSFGPLTNSVSPRIWGYKSADVAATVAGSNYFTNGAALGMKVNDLILVVDTATPLITSHRVIGTTTISLSAGVTVGNT